MANVSRWLADEGLAVGGLTPARVEMFVIARREAGTYGDPRDHGAREAADDEHDLVEPCARALGGGEAVLTPARN